MKTKLQSVSHSDTCLKNGHSHGSVVGCGADRLQLCKTTLHLGSMPANQWNATKNCCMHVCMSVRTRTHALQPALGNRKGLVLLQDNTSLSTPQPPPQKLVRFGYKAWPLLYPSELLPTNYNFFKHLDNISLEESIARKMLKMLSKSSSNPKALIFTLQE